MKNYFKIYPINNFIYQIQDRLGVLSTLVIGEQKALLFDTGYGIGNLKQEVEKLTPLPLIVINSHGHMDHTCGNYLFDKVYIHPNDIAICKIYNSRSWRRSNIERAQQAKISLSNFDIDFYLHQNEGNLNFLESNHIFDLGNCHVQVIEMFGHTKGSIGLLLIEAKILLVGDATCPWVWLFLDESTTVASYLEMLDQTLTHAFESILLGHGPGLISRDEIYKYYQIADNIDLSYATKATFVGFEHLKCYCYTNGKIYNHGDCGIFFNPDKLK